MAEVPIEVEVLSSEGTIDFAQDRVSDDYRQVFKITADFRDGVRTSRYVYEGPDDAPIEREEDCDTLTGEIEIILTLEASQIETKPIDPKACVCGAAWEYW